MVFSMVLCDNGIFYGIYGIFYGSLYGMFMVFYGKKQWFFCVFVTFYGFSRVYFGLPEGFLRLLDFVHDVRVLFLEQQRSCRIEKSQLLI